MISSYKITDEAVKKATGKGWEEWVKILDKEGAEKLNHKEIARLLFDKGYIKSGWWCQSVTVGYEYAKGLRSVGETKTQGVEIGVSKTIPVRADKLWRYVFSNEGLKIWLGEIDGFKLEPGFKFQTKDGTVGEIRTVKANERIRISYLPKDFNKPSTLQIYFMQKIDKTSLGFHNEKLENKKMREIMKKHWGEVLSNIYDKFS
jgi:uncharacterized protein YndB with AHSA1/START domain